MNIAICDNGENTRIYIRKMIEAQDARCRIMEFTSGEELLAFWELEEREEIDLLFLDISMEGINGIAVAEQIRKRMLEKNNAARESLPLLIFVTGNPESKKSAEPKEVLLRDGNVTRSVPTDDIYYIESNNRKIIVHMRDEVIECYGKIGELELELKEGFFRIHKGYLVNMKYVEGYNRTEVRVKNGNILLLSKYKYQDFAKAYQKFISLDK